MHKTLIGKVIKKSSANTIKVLVKRQITHPVYKKQYTLSKNYLVHDASGNHEIGDTVTINETKPISKLKHFIVQENSKLDLRKITTDPKREI